MGGGAMLTDGAWMRLEPLIEACRPKGKTPPQDLRRTISAILWRHQNGAKWRAIPAELGPWSRAAQMFIRWAHLGVWERLLLLAQERGVQRGMTFLDGTSIRAHHKAAGSDGRWPLSWLRVRLMNSRRPSRSSTACPGCPSGWWRTGAMPGTLFASTSGSVAPVRRSRPSRTKPQWRVRTGSTITATTWSGSGRGSRSGARSRPVTRRRPHPSWASSASLPPSIGSSPNRPLYGDTDVKVRVQRQRSSGFVGREDGYELIRGEFAIGRAGHRAATLYPVGLLGPEP